MSGECSHTHNGSLVRTYCTAADNQPCTTKNTRDAPIRHWPIIGRPIIRA